MREHRLQALRVMLRCVNAAAVRHAHDHGARQAAPGAVAHAGHVVGNLVESRVDETHELDFGDRLQSLCRHADGHSGDHAFGERRVLHAILAELLLQSRRRPEDTTVDSDVLSQHHYGRVVRHLPRVRAVDGFDHRNFGHEGRET